MVCERRQRLDSASQRYAAIRGPFDALASHESLSIGQRSDRCSGVRAVSAANPSVTASPSIVQLPSSVV